MNLRKLSLIAVSSLLACQLGVAQSAAPNHGMAASAIAKVNATGKAVPVVPTSAVAGQAAARPNVWLGKSLASGLKLKPSIIGNSEPPFCETVYGPYFIFCPKGITTAYGISSIVGANGGAGQTIAIVDAYSYPNAEADLAQFDSDMGLPACTTGNGCFTAINLSSTPSDGTGWDLESMLDLEYAHTMAPKAKIIYIQAATNSYDDLGTAVDLGAGLADVVSNSWSGGEYPPDDFYWTVPKVLLFASGDYGSWPEQGYVGYPCSVGTVTCVGGTSLYVNGSLQRTSEAGWADGGGGCSQEEPMPSYQGNNGSGQCYPYRASPDIAADADPYTGVAVFINDGEWGDGYWIVGGTSLATPLTAGLVSDINTARQSFGKSKLTFLNNDLYAGASANYGYFFYDVTTGNNGYPATPQFDLVTGLGNLTGKDAANRFFGLP